MTDLHILGGALFLVGLFFLWVKFYYEPRQRKLEQHHKQLFEASVAQMLLKNSARDSQKMVLTEIVQHRPTIESWPEWTEVWDGKPPVH